MTMTEPTSLKTESHLSSTEKASSSPNTFNNFSHLETLSRQIEVLLHASETPLTANQLRKNLSAFDAPLTKQELETALLILQQRLALGVLTLNHSASGYRLQVQSQYSALIQKVFPQRLDSLSQALLETLSVIAYKQPVTRSDIEHIRGVTVSSSILRQLFDKGWIIEKGYRETLGRPALLYTTAQFLDAFGVERLEDLPPLPELILGGQLEGDL